MTTNLGFDNRTAVSGNPNMTTALLDRLTHKARIIECAPENYRLKETLKEGRERNHIQLKTAVDLPRKPRTQIYAPNLPFS